MIDKESKVGEDYTEEFNVCSREKHGPRLI